MSKLRYREGRKFFYSYIVILEGGRNYGFFKFRFLNLVFFLWFYSCVFIYRNINKILKEMFSLFRKLIVFESFWEFIKLF